MNRTDQILRDSIERNENKALWCAASVVFGLFIEVVLAIWFHDSETPVGRWGVVVADTIVALGVAGEVFFGRKARLDSEELTRRSEARLANAVARSGEASVRAAEAEVQSAAAQLEAEKLRAALAARRLTKEQFEVISSKLAGRMIPLVLRVAPGDSEARLLAEDIRKSLNASDIEQKVAVFMSPEIILELRIHPRAGSAVDIDAELIVSVFRDAGLEVEVSTPEPILMLDVGSKLS